MDASLIKELYDLHVMGFEKAFCNVIKYDKYDLVYNNNIKDYYDNFISNFHISNLNEFKEITTETSKIFKSIGRKNILYLLPFMNECYNNKEKYFIKNDFKLISEETWQIFTDFEYLKNLKTNCTYNVELEPAKNMNSYATYMLECFKSDDIDDPYGNVDDEYGKEFAKFNSTLNNIKCNAFYIKADGKIVGVLQSVSNKNYCGIYGFAIEKNFRKKGIGKEAILKHLNVCKENRIKIVFLQTEKGYYPYEMYKKIGFRDLFNAFYYEKIE